MDRRFHIFVRRLAAGVAAAPITMPHLGAFGPDVESARRDLSFVLRRLLAHDELREERAFFADARLRRVGMVLRCLHGRRLLEVPMKFSVLTFSSAESDARDAAPAPAPSGRLRILIPRLGIDGQLDDPADLDAYLEEIIRHELHLAPLERLMEVAYAGDESLETMIVPLPPSAVRPARAAQPRRTPVLLPPALGEACQRLDLPGREDALERAYQRDTELGLLEQHLGSRTRASVLLVGPAGVGKTCLVHELAARNLAREGDERLEIYSTSGSRILAGMRYLGEWQERLRNMVAELRERRAALHFESLGELLARGKGDGIDLARFLLPAIEAGEATVIAEATPEDVARAGRSHMPLLQALRPLVLAPLGAAPARQALAHVGLRIGRARRLRFADAALDRALDLAERFDEGCLPGAAVALLRAAASGRPREASPGPGAPAVVDAGAVTEAFHARTGYPRVLVDPTLPLDPEAVHAHFRSRVLGQEHATVRLAQLVVTLKTNLTDARKPLGSFLLLGPTGVGKTESALALTAFLFGDERRLRRFDMAEYAAPGSARRLLADDPQGLVRRTREQPFGVLLLDEIEKADAGVLDLLLQLLGEGRLADERGQRVSFRNTIVVLTSNLGAATAGRSLGFGGPGEEARDAHYRAAAAAFFRPELLNRFDQIIAYRPLTHDVVRAIARQALLAALAREGLQRRGTVVEFDEAVVDALVAIGFDPLLGARPLKRAVERHVVAPLAELLGQAHRPVNGLRLRVSEGGAIEIERRTQG
jgi:ATP-dependent Clp protease ATP-binding subunit ClpC